MTLDFSTFLRSESVTPAGRALRLATIAVAALAIASGAALAETGGSTIDPEEKVADIPADATPAEIYDSLTDLDADAQTEAWQALETETRQDVRTYITESVSDYYDSLSESELAEEKRLQEQLKADIADVSPEERREMIQNYGKALHERVFDAE